jgi:hypothetical protein
MDDSAMTISWEKSIERWDLPLTADDQRGLWIRDGAVLDFVTAHKLDVGATIA